MYLANDTNMLCVSATDVVTVYVFQEPSLLSSLQDNGLTDVVLNALLVKDVSQNLFVKCIFTNKNEHPQIILPRNNGTELIKFHIIKSERCNRAYSSMIMIYSFFNLCLP